MYTKLLSTEEITNDWHLYKDLLADALSHGQGETPLSEYLRRLLAYQAQLWVIYDEHNDHELKGCLLSQFLQYTNYQSLHMIACSGNNWADWSQTYYDLEKFAKDNNCKTVEMWGRPGWSKMMPKMLPGFETVYHVLKKDI